MSAPDVIDDALVLTGYELEGVEALLGEALSSLAAEDPCDAADCIERVMSTLGLR